MKQTLKQQEQKRNAVMIAKDVIATIRARRAGKAVAYKMVTGTVLQLNSDHWWEWGSDFRQYLSETSIVAPCSVCAIGAVLASYAVRNDKLTIGEIKEAKTALSKSYSLFGTQTTQAIELAFERGRGLIGNDGQRTPASGLTGEQANEAIDFGLRFNSVEDRALAIYKRIVRNGGVFFKAKS